WLRLAGEDGQAQFQNRAHFFGAAAEAMRRILIEGARRRLAAKRGSGAVPLDVNEMEIPSPAADDDTLLLVNEALEKFWAVDPRKAELVKLRYFVGMNFEENGGRTGHCRADGQAVVGLCPRLAHGRDARGGTTMTTLRGNRSKNPSRKRNPVFRSSIW